MASRAACEDYGSGYWYIDDGDGSGSCECYDQYTSVNCSFQMKDVIWSIYRPTSAIIIAIHCLLLVIPIHISNACQ
jgi:hypothetical protein